MDNDTKIKKISEQLRTFLWQRPRTRLLAEREELEDCGWCSGGCGILGDAIELWLGEPGKKVMLSDEQRGRAQHILYKIGEYYLDGEGITHEASVLEYGASYGLPAPYLERFSVVASRRDGQILRDPDLSRRLADALERRFPKEKILKILRS